MSPQGQPLKDDTAETVTLIAQGCLGPLFILLAWLAGCAIVIYAIVRFAKWAWYQ